MKRLKKTSTITDSAVLAETALLNEREVITTDVPILNIAFNAEVFGGFCGGVHQIAGDSRMFKTGFSLVCLRAFQNKYKEGVAIFYDSEFGAGLPFFNSMGIDTSRVLHTPITNVEMLRTDLAKQLSELKRGDQVMIIVDSVGNLASAKEIKDAESGSEAADMTRAKVINSLYRIITPSLLLKNIPFFAVGHTYDTMEMFARKVLSGGKKQFLAADSIWFITRETEKDKAKKAVTGWTFNIRVEKSRFVREQTIFSVDVSLDNGINRYSSLMPLAVGAGLVLRPNLQTYAKVNTETGEVGEPLPEAKTNNEEFWDSILNSKKFQDYVRERFSLPTGNLISEYESVVKGEEDE